MQLDKLSIAVEANTAAAVAGFERLTKGVDRMAVALEKSGRASDGAGKKATGLGQSMFLASRQVFYFSNALGIAKNKLIDVYQTAEEGARNATAETFFVKAGKSLEEYRKATHGLISDADLVKKANLADTMGINGEAFKSLALVAQAASAKTGQSYKHMLDSIVVGTARESRLLLDNLGIIVNVTKAREDYIQKLRESGQLGERASESNKKLATQLTDEAEKVAFLTAAMASGKPMLEEYANSGDKASESFDKFNAAIANLKDSIGRGLSTVLSGVLPQLTEFINELTRAVSLLDSDSWNVVKEIMLAVGAAGLAVGGIPGAVLGAAAGGIGAGIGVAQDTGRGQIIQQQEDLLAVLQGTTDASITLRDVLAMHEQDIEAFTMRWGDLDVQQEQAIKDLIDTIRALSEKLGTEVNKLPPLKPVTGSGVTFKPSEGKTRKTPEWLVSTEKNAYTDFAEWAGRSQKKADEYLEKFHKEDLARKEKWEEHKQKRLEAAFKAELAEHERQLQVRQDLYDKIAGGIDIGGAAAAGDAAGFIQGIATAIGAAFGAPQIGSAIGGILGPLLEKLQPVANIFMNIANGAVVLVSLAFQELFDALEPLGPALFFLLGAVGELIGSAIRPLIPLLSFVVQGVAWFIDALAVAILFLSPFVELIVKLYSVFFLLADLVIALVEIFSGYDMGDNLKNWSDSFGQFTGIMLDAGIYIHNVLVTFFRGLGKFLDDTIGSDFGLSEFGKLLSREDFSTGEKVEPIDDNTDATKENTKAVRELAREFRNLPQGYRVNRALFNAETPRGGIQPIPGFRPIPVSPNRNFRFRP